MNKDLFKELESICDKIIYLKAELRLCKDLRLCEDKRIDKVCEELEEIRGRLFQWLYMRRQ